MAAVVIGAARRPDSPDVSHVQAHRAARTLCLLYVYIHSKQWPNAYLRVPYRNLKLILRPEKRDDKSIVFVSIVMYDVHFVRSVTRLEMKTANAACDNMRIIITSNTFGLRI